MKLLVTGGAGYIGSVVASRLLASGHEVTVYDSLERGHREAVPAGARFYEGDLADQRALDEVLRGQGFDGVMHFAAYALVAESVAEPELYYRNNVGGSLNLLEAMVQAGVPRLVFSSTCAVYGEPETVPIPETCPTSPVNSYGASKLAVDWMISHFARAHGLAATSLRYFNVAGSAGHIGEDHEPETHLIPNVLKAASGITPHVNIFGTDYPTPDGTAVRDYIHVEDLSDAHGLAMEANAEGVHKIYNLGNGNGFSVRQVIDACAKVTGREIPVVESPRRPGDPPMLVGAAEKIRTELGWTANKPEIETMVADAWAFMQANPQGYPKAD